MARTLKDRDLITAVLEQCNVIHREHGEGIIRRVEATTESMDIEFHDVDGASFNVSSAADFEWVEGFEDYAVEEG